MSRFRVWTSPHHCSSSILWRSSQHEERLFFTSRTCSRSSSASVRRSSLFTKGKSKLKTASDVYATCCTFLHSKKYSRNSSSTRTWKPLQRTLPGLSAGTDKNEQTIRGDAWDTWCKICGSVVVFSGNRLA